MKNKEKPKWHIEKYEANKIAKLKQGLEGGIVSVRFVFRKI